MSGFRLNLTITITKTGNSRFAGNAARNCATGWIFSASEGRRPISTPMGSHTTDASAISTVTRSSVMRPSTNTWPTSSSVTPVRTYATTRYTTNAVASTTITAHTMSPVLDGLSTAGFANFTGPTRGQRIGTRAAFANIQPMGT